VKTFVSAKLHNLYVTDKSLRYHGSASIDASLLKIAGIDPYEQVHIVNLSNGNRWVTYALPSEEGVFTLNGGGARLGEVGDTCIVIAYRQEEVFSGVTVVYCTPDNQVQEVLQYARS